MPSRDKYPECATCINREYDLFQCRGCREASNYEPESEDDECLDVEEELSYEDFRNLMG